MTAQAERRRGNGQNFFQDFIKGRSRALIPPLVATVLCLLVWQLLFSGKGANLPPPTQVIGDTWELITSPFDGEMGQSDAGLGWQLLTSLGRVAMGYSLAALVGITVGVIIGSNPLIYNAFDPIFQVLRTVPPLAWLPIALAGFQNNGPAAIFVIFITAIWPILLNTAVGVQQIPQDYRNVSKVLQLSNSEYFLKILLPATVPYMFTGLRIGIGLAWLAIVAAEMLKADGGIGFFIWDAYNSGSNSEVILAVLYVGIVGFVLDKAIAFLGSLLVPAEQK